MASGHRGLPHLALLELAVAEQHVDAVARAVDPSGEGQPVGERQALAERAGGAFEAGRLAHVGVALEAGAELLEGEELVGGEHAVHGQAHVLGGHGVAFAQHHAIAVGVAGLAGHVVHLVEVEHGEQLDDGERAAEVVGLAHAHHAHERDADLPGTARQRAVLLGGEHRRHSL